MAKNENPTYPLLHLIYHLIASENECHRIKQIINMVLSELPVEVVGPSRVNVANSSVYSQLDS